MTDHSFATAAAQRLVDRLGREGAHREIDRFFAQQTIVEQAAHEYDWENVWARSKQIPPDHDWQSWGGLCGRGWGKTLTISKYVNAEAQSGRAMLIGLAAQDEDNAIKLQITGPSGLIATAPPWFKPQWEASKLELVWPNGAKAIVRTPEVPGKIRGFDYHLTWLTEIQSWPVATREEAYMNFLLATRLGYARIVWDATSKRRHPLLKKFLKQGEADPERHVVFRGPTKENAYNLGDGYIEKLEAEMGGTQRGREELLGEMLEESETALVKQAAIDGARRYMPEALVRRVIGIDPAVTARSGSDRTGIVEAGLGVDDHAYVLGDYSGKHDPPKWASIVLDTYTKNGCDLVVVETNKGGQLVTQNLRAAAGDRGLTVVVIGDQERPHRIAGTVYVKEVHARGPKEDRAQPLATAYARGKVSHIRGVDLAALEDMLTTWEPTPGQRSPDALDALVHAVGELLGLGSNKVDASAGFKGIEVLGRAVTEPARGPARSIAALLGGSGGSGRI